MTFWHRSHFARIGQSISWLSPSNMLGSWILCWRNMYLQERYELHKWFAEKDSQNDSQMQQEQFVIFQDGRDRTAVQWIKMQCSAYRIAVVTEHSTWTVNHAIVTRNGVAMTVPKVHKLLFFYFDDTIVLIQFWPIDVAASVELCDLNCGINGRCVGETCQCETGWGGQYCNTKLCDPRCNEHGQCKNGTCLCVTGWNGKHCTIEGCPASCSNHGQCRVGNEGLWECRCYDGWDGADCSVALELNCDDNKDNDKGSYR